MKLTLATRTKDGILVVDCSGRIVFGEESSLLRSTVKDALSENKHVSDLLQVTKLITVFDVYNSEAEAIESFRKAA